MERDLYHMALQTLPVVYGIIISNQISKVKYLKQLSSRTGQIP